ncbi:carboxymuconolactone decarboxylase family protein [Dehalococcoidia bacterium]|nr:carboxymuconolactone decarboxylase family protein [Dehalococcoidia bacterium]
MSWIQEITDSDATGKLRELFDSIKGRTSGNIANILRVHSLNPEALEAHLNLYKTIMFGESSLTRTQREMIATVVSNTNRCEY